MRANDYGIPHHSINTKKYNPMQYWKAYNKPLVISYLPLKIKIWIWKILTFKKEFSHLLCSVYGLRCMHPHNWYLVGCDANWQSIEQHKQALINKVYQKENRRRLYNVNHTGDKVLLKNAWKIQFT